MDNNGDEAPRPPDTSALLWQARVWQRRSEHALWGSIAAEAIGGIALIHGGIQAAYGESLRGVGGFAIVYGVGSLLLVGLSVFAQSRARRFDRLAQQEATADPE